MTDYALFADILVNKSKLKPLNPSQSNQTPPNVPNTPIPGVTRDDDILSCVNQIFAQAIDTNALDIQDPQTLLQFLKLELPNLIIKYHKYCYGKNE